MHAIRLISFVIIQLIGAYETVCVYEISRHKISNIHVMFFYCRVPKFNFQSGATNSPICIMHAVR